MSDATPIQTLDSTMVRVTLGDALKKTNPVRVVSDFLAGVDWSTVDGEPAADVVELLNEAESITTEAEEGDITLAAFLDGINRLASSSGAESSRKTASA